MKQHLSYFAFLMFILSATPATVAGQAGNFGAGFQIGSPTGITVRYDFPDGTSIDGAMAWHFNRRMVIQSHYLLSQGTMQTQGGTELHYFMGPGAFIATRGARDDFDIGASGNFGLAYYYDVFEFFGQFTPQFAFVPETRFLFGIGIGARYYF